MNTIKDMKLETDRLIIRPYKEEDLMDCFKLMQNPDLFTYLDMEVMAFEEYKGLFAWLMDSYNREFDEEFKYSFNIILKESGKHIGWCGVGGIEFNHKQKEIYYLIGKEYWGHGYAKEAVSALLEYCFQTIRLDSIAALCKPENIASKKIIESLGFTYQNRIQGLSAEFDYFNGDLYYELTRENV